MVARTPAHDFPRRIVAACAFNGSLVSSLAISIVLLAACSGGGGGSSGGSSGGGGVRTVSAPDPVSIPDRPAAQPVGQAESSANYGIARIGADIAYAAGATGRNVRVAVIDSGISLDHPEFAGRIDRSASIDIVTGRRSTLEDESGHGSHVAGIIAANIDGNGMRGVAPNATLVAVRADLRDSSLCASPGCGYFDSDVAAALDHARKQNVDIVNLSIGKDSPVSDAYRNALARIIDKGALVVVAAGNDGIAEPLAPGRLANASGIRGGMLVAGAVDRNSAIFRSTNKAGDVAPYFLVAPGVEVYSTYRDEGYQRLTGTSMAAPHVAGAAAVVKSAFPSLSMKEVGEILVRTADDLGPRGTDQTFGSGLINLERALQPIGRQQVAAGTDVDGQRFAIENSRLSLGTSFGDALSSNSTLAQGMVLDEYDRPYRANFKRLIQQSGGAVDLESRLIEDRSTRSVPVTALSPLGVDARLSFSEARDQPVAGSTRAAMLSARADTGPAFERLALKPFESSQGSATVGLGFAPSTVGATPHATSAQGLFLDGDSLLAPADAIVDRGSGAMFRIVATDDLVIHAGLLDSTVLQTDSDNDDGLAGRLATVGAGYRLSDALDLQVSYAYLDETESLLGSSASGAFAFSNGAASHLGTARLGYRALGGIELFAQATIGVSQMDDDSGLLRDWSAVQSEAFALGVIAADVAQDGDRLGLVLGQPLRVSNASATLDMPVARTSGGDVERVQEQVGLTPSGRELRLELAYQRALAEDDTLGTWLMLQHEPGHDASADPAMGIGVRYTRRF